MEEEGEKNEEGEMKNDGMEKDEWGMRRNKRG